MTVKVDERLLEQFKQKVQPFTISAFVKMLMAKVVSGELVFEAVQKEADQ
jgi:hypothetical protein